MQISRGITDQQNLQAFMAYRTLLIKKEDSGSVENGSTSFQKLLECIQAWEPKLTFIGGGRIATALICGFESVGKLHFSM
ncbi:unnamed protein product [Cercopithifilaria johnstoni]|uniref:Uncharacterized protein n=1 Tax=Cercopithifilaria johnstoni TaxID=2874296 RepID=A0A8J2MSA8_9BILA|nr:unnamed protein product [Cercopithifilaria johnstoni]